MVTRCPLRNGGMSQAREGEGMKMPKTETETTPYVIVRTNSAGCFAGLLISREGEEAVLNSCRRLWYWAGAASLSQLATEGTSAQEQCKFPPHTNGHIVRGVIEVIPVTEQARTSIEGVPVW